MSADARDAREPWETMARLRVGQSVPQDEVPAGHDYIGGFGWFKVHQPGERLPAPPAGLSAEALERRRLAEKLAEALAHPLENVPVSARGNDVVFASSVYAPVAEMPVAQRAIADAAKVTEEVMLTPGEARVYPNGAGIVVLVHGPAWSLVFNLSSVDTVVRVCADELGEWALSVDEDPDPGVRHRLIVMAYDVLFQLQRLSIGGDLFTAAGSDAGR